MKNILIDYQNINAPIPEILVPDVEFDVLKKIVKFLYCGIISINPTEISDFVGVCNLLQIKGSINCVGSFNGIKITGSMNEDEVPTDSLPPSHSSTPVQQKSKKVLNSITVDESTTETLANLVADLQEEEDTTDKCEESEEGKEGEKTENMIFYEIEEVQETHNENDESEEQYTIEMEDKNTSCYPSTSKEHQSESSPVFQQALDDVFGKRMSFHQAAEKYNLSKTLLWRKAKKLGYEKSERPKSSNRLSAIEDIKRGDSLLNVSKRFSIPIATLHRDKLQLFHSGELPENVSFKLRKRGEDFDDRLRVCICDILNGKSQNEAAKTHDIPKATVWRIMRKLDLSFLDRSQPIEPYSDQINRVMESYTGYTKRKSVPVTSAEHVTNVKIIYENDLDVEMDSENFKQETSDTSDTVLYTTTTKNEQQSERIVTHIGIPAKRTRKQAFPQ